MDHQKTLLLAANGGPLSTSSSPQWLATSYSQYRADCYATGGPVVALQSLAIWDEHGLLYGQLSGACIRCNLYNCVLHDIMRESFLIIVNMMLNLICSNF